MPAKKQFYSEALQCAWDTFIGDDPEKIAQYEEELVNIEIAEQIYDLRTKAGLSHSELAEKVGTTASVISRLEEADYQGNTLAMMKRVGEALDRGVEIRFVPLVKGPAGGRAGTKRKAS